MKAYVLAFGVLLVAGIAQGAQVTTCTFIGEQIEDDVSCTQYYVCQLANSITANCPAGQNFFSGRGCVDALANPCLKAGTATTGTGTTAATCATLVCANGGRCFEDATNPARCFCADGFTGTTCTETVVDGTCPVPTEERCDPGCLNGGRCFNDGTTPKCYCNAGFAGTRCETALASCTDLNCQNGGLCVTENGKDICQCVGNFAGTLCQLAVTAECARLRCENNAACVVTGTTTTCNCPTGFSGDRCQYEDQCPKITCLNGGVCKTGDRGQASCECNTGFSGSFCEVALNCDNYQCFNGGTCVIEDAQRKCNCKANTEGDLCEKRLTCSTDGKAPCENGGACVNSEDGFVCVCPFQWIGQFCDVQRTCSDDVICSNGGTCEFDATTGVSCKCTDTFQGPRCDTPKDDCGGCQNGGQCLMPYPAAEGAGIAKICSCPPNYSGDNCEVSGVCTQPCPANIGIGGERWKLLVYPDLVNRDYVYLCKTGLLQHYKFCEDPFGWFDPFAVGGGENCLSGTQLANARLTAGNALFPGRI